MVAIPKTLHKSAMADHRSVCIAWVQVGGAKGDGVPSLLPRHHPPGSDCPIFQPRYGVRHQVLSSRPASQPPRHPPYRPEEGRCWEDDGRENLSAFWLPYPLFDGYYWGGYEYSRWWLPVIGYLFLFSVIWLWFLGIGIDLGMLWLIAFFIVVMLVWIARFEVYYLIVTIFLSVLPYKIAQFEVHYLFWQ